MYCPKCGTENAETNKYCRACRENLGVISQAMKRRLPVMIASRLDQMLDSRNERFRRNGILYLLMGGSFLVAKLSGSFTGLETLWGISIFYILLGAWEYLAYRRSLATDFDWGMPSEETTNAERFVTLGIGDGHTGNIARTTDKKNS
jgi:hypothetical protein